MYTQYFYSSRSRPAAPALPTSTTSRSSPATTSARPPQSSSATSSTAPTWQRPRRSSTPSQRGSRGHSTRCEKENCFTIVFYCFLVMKSSHKIYYQRFLRQIVQHISSGFANSSAFDSCSTWTFCTQTLSWQHKLRWDTLIPIYCAPIFDWSDISVCLPFAYIVLKTDFVLVRESKVTFF